MYMNGYGLGDGSTPIKTLRSPAAVQAQVQNVVQKTRQTASSDIRGRMPFEPDAVSSQAYSPDFVLPENYDVALAPQIPSWMTWGLLGTAALMFFASRS